MNYHNITKDDMLNGSGLRVVLWLSGCSHHCKGCQNPQTWDENSGIPFDEDAKEELFRELSKDYISGITFSGGDPMHENNLDEVLQLIEEIKYKFPNKTIWLYTGYTLGECEPFSENGVVNPDEFAPKLQCILRKRWEIIKNIDVLIDGRYKEKLRDISLHWIGSSNQRVIDIKRSLKKGEVVLWDTN